MSYTTFDDEYEDGRITELRELLERTLRFKGKKISVFQDIVDIKSGEVIDERIRQAIDECRIFIPIVTNNYLKRDWCRDELELFFERERQLCHNNLVIWFYYDEVPELESAFQQPLWRQKAGKLDGSFISPDSLIARLSGRQYRDWRELRKSQITLKKANSKVKNELEELALEIIAILKELDEQEKQERQKGRKKQNKQTVTKKAIATRPDEPDILIIMNYLVIASAAVFAVLFVIAIFLSVNLYLSNSQDERWSSSISAISITAIYQHATDDETPMWLSSP